MTHEEQYERLRAEIIDLEDLTRDYTSFDSSQVSRESIIASLVILEDLYEKNFLPSKIFPSSEPSVVLWYNFEGREADIEVYEDGVALVGIYYKYKYCEIPDYNEIGIDETIKRISDWIYLGV